MRFLPFALVAFTIGASAASPAKRGITAEDYFAFETINDAHLSPDGKQAVYVRTIIDQKRNRRDSSVWVVGVDGNAAPKRLTSEGVNATSPRWSPDGARI